MSVPARTFALLVAVLATSLVQPAGFITPTTTLVQASTNPPNSTSLPTTIFFTDQNLNLLPLDIHGNPKVEANVTISQICTMYGGKEHHCIATRNSYTLRNTSPAEVVAWIKVTRASGAPLQSLRMNETLPNEWAVNPAWRNGGTMAIHVYYANTTRVSTDPEITQFSGVNFLPRSAQVLRLAITNFNTTAMGHPLEAGQSLLVSVKLNCTLLGADERSNIYPKNYTDSVATAAWIQKSYSGSESTNTTSAFFTTYATYPTPESAPPRPLQDSILSLLPFLGFAIAAVAMGFAFVALSKRRKRSREYPTATPQQR